MLSKLLPVQVQCFGLAMVRLDIRQESTRHSDAVSAITNYLGMGNYRYVTVQCCSAAARLCVAQTQSPCSCRCSQHWLPQYGRYRHVTMWRAAIGLTACNADQLMLTSTGCLLRLTCQAPVLQRVGRGEAAGVSAAGAAGQAAPAASRSGDDRGGCSCDQRLQGAVLQLPAFVNCAPVLQKLTRPSAAGDRRPTNRLPGGVHHLDGAELLRRPGCALAAGVCTP